MANAKLILSDGEVLELVREGNEEVFRLIVERYQRRLLTYVARHFRLDDRAVEITQEALFRLFCKILRDPNLWLENNTLQPLLIRIAGAVAVDELRGERSRRELQHKLTRAPGAEPSRPDEDLLAAEIVREVWSALAKLPPTLQTAALLYFADGYSSTEVARLTKSAPGVAKGRIARARELLITYLEPFWKGVNT
jgi:RNA polymerase sigma-70 factor (ECF subfamily)